MRFLARIILFFLLGAAGTWLFLSHSSSDFNIARLQGKTLGGNASNAQIGIGSYLHSNQLLQETIFPKLRSSLLWVSGFTKHLADEIESPSGESEHQPSSSEVVIAPAPVPTPISHLSQSDNEEMHEILKGVQGVSMPGDAPQLHASHSIKGY
jgi:hypothetical protein